MKIVKNLTEAFSTKNPEKSNLDRIDKNSRQPAEKKLYGAVKGFLSLSGIQHARPILTIERFEKTQAPLSLKISFDQADGLPEMPKSIGHNALGKAIGKTDIQDFIPFDHEMNIVGHTLQSLGYQKINMILPFTIDITLDETKEAPLLLSLEVLNGPTEENKNLDALDTLDRLIHHLDDMAGLG